MRSMFVVMVCSALMVARAQAQISPPGLGEAKTAGWVALGARQDLDAIHRLQSMTYVGMDVISDPDHVEVATKPSIVVVNEEIFDHFAKQWTYSLAFSYRRQNLYEEEPPYTHEHDPGYKRELRAYGRISHIREHGRFKLTSTFRPELRNFFRPSFALLDESMQLRIRAREQLTAHVDHDKEHNVIASAEVLAASSKQRGSWRALAYTESRFCLYYSLARQHSPVVFHIGYMNNLLGRAGQMMDVHYLALDLTWKNPFGNPS